MVRAENSVWHIHSESPSPFPLSSTPLRPCWPLTPQAVSSFHLSLATGPVKAGGRETVLPLPSVRPQAVSPHGSSHPCPGCPGRPGRPGCGSAGSLLPPPPWVLQPGGGKLLLAAANSECRSVSSLLLRSATTSVFQIFRAVFVLLLVPLTTDCKHLLSTLFLLSSLSHASEATLE